jgi:hypothetical protein
MSSLALPPRNPDHGLKSYLSALRRRRLERERALMRWVWVLIFSGGILCVAVALRFCAPG